MNFDERPLWVRCGDETLLGLLSVPPGVRAPERAVVMAVGGPQYRAGSHRQFTLLARALAAAGVAVLRFDHRGMGDSSGVPRSFEDCAPDIGAAVDAMCEQLPSVREVGLFGLCDGASAALLYLAQSPDRRIGSLCLLNPWVRSAVTLAQTEVRHYYTRRLLQPELWRKLLRGGLRWQAVRDFVRSLVLALRRGSPAAAPDTAPDFRQRMLGAWQRFDGRVLVVTSGRDFVAREFLALARADEGWRQVLARPGVHSCLIDEADHTFSDRATHDRLQEQVLAFFAGHPHGMAAQAHDA